MDSVQHSQQARSSPEAIGAEPFLLVHTGSCLCAIPLAGVTETMRLLPIQAVPGMPPYVAGVAVIRGETVPVVGLGALLHAAEEAAPQRLVVLRAGDRRVALAVESVVGVRSLDPRTAQGVPPLLTDAQPELIAGIGSLDRDLLLVLQSSRILPADVWAELGAHQPKM